MNELCIFGVFSYFLERSNSAKITLTRARELFPMEVHQGEGRGGRGGGKRRSKGEGYDTDGREGWTTHTV